MAEPKQPIVVRIGRANKKQVELLREGQGPLVDEVHETVAEIRARLGSDAAGRELVPVVVVYSKKSKKKGSKGLWSGAGCDRWF
jgi:hypothetical protein